MPLFARQRTPEEELHRRLLDELADVLSSMEAVADDIDEMDDGPARNDLRQLYAEYDRRYAEIRQDIARIEEIAFMQGRTATVRRGTTITKKHKFSGKDFYNHLKKKDA